MFINQRVYSKKIYLTILTLYLAVSVISEYSCRLAIDLLGFSEAFRISGLSGMSPFIIWNTRIKVA